MLERRSRSSGTRWTTPTSRRVQSQITINEAFTRLGIEYAAYVKAGGTPLLDVVAKYTTDTNNDGIPERLQSPHDNLLGNLSEAALQQRWRRRRPAAWHLCRARFPAIDPDLLDRPYASGNAGSAGNTAAHAWDVANDLQSQISGQLIGDGRRSRCDAGVDRCRTGDLRHDGDRCHRQVDLKAQTTRSPPRRPWHRDPSSRPSLRR